MTIFTNSSITKALIRLQTPATLQDALNQLLAEQNIQVQLGSWKQQSQAETPVEVDLENSEKPALENVDPGQEVTTPRPAPSMSRTAAASTELPRHGLQLQFPLTPLFPAHFHRV